MNQKELLKRKEIRLKEYDYSKEGYYFITICTKDRKKILSKITLNDENINLINNSYKNVGADASVRPKQTNKYVNNILTNIGKIIENSLININKIYNNVFIDEYIIMPNHVHMKIGIYGRTEASAPTKNNSRI